MASCAAQKGFDLVLRGSRAVVVGFIRRLRWLRTLTEVKALGKSSVTSQCLEPTEKVSEVENTLAQRLGVDGEPLPRLIGELLPSSDLPYAAFVKALTLSIVSRTDLDLLQHPQANKRPTTIYMNIAKRSDSHICIICLHRQNLFLGRYRKNDTLSRGLAQSTDSPLATSKCNEESKSTSEANGQGQAEDRMSGRLAQMTDEMLEQGNRSAKKAIKEGGFSEELKRKLEARLQESSFRSENTAAFAQVNLPVRSYRLIT